MPHLLPSVLLLSDSSPRRRVYWWDVDLKKNRLLCRGGSGLCCRVRRGKKTCVNSLQPCLFDTRKLPCSGRRSERCLTCHVCLFSHWESPQFINSTETKTSRRRKKNGHTLVSQRWQLMGKRSEAGQRGGDWTDGCLPVHDSVEPNKHSHTCTRFFSGPCY